MKKIFFSQNKINLLIIQSIIEKNEFKKEECIIITFDEHFDLKIAANNFNSIKYQIKSKILFPLSWLELENKKHLLEQDLNLQEPFVFFNSNYSLWICTYLHNHPNCHTRYFVESGTSAYFTINEFKRYYDFRLKYNAKHNLVRMIIWLNHYFSHTINPNKNLQRIEECKTVFSLNKNAFEHSNVQVVKDVFTNVEFDFSFDMVWAPTALTSSMGSIERGSLIKIYQSVVDILIEKGYKKIFLKLHPRETTTIIEYFKYLKRNTSELDIIIADKSISVENILYSINVPLLTDTSSLALYAHTLDRPCYSYYKELCSQSKMFYKRFVIKPAILKNCLKSIDQIPSIYEDSI